MTTKKKIDEIGDLIEDYLANCGAIGVKRRTVDNNYGHSLRSVFLPYCKGAGVRALAQVDDLFLDHFANDLRKRKASQQDNATVAAQHSQGRSEHIHKVRPDERGGTDR